MAQSFSTMVVVIMVVFGEYDDRGGESENGGDGGDW